MNVSVVVLVVWLMFAILGITLFGGKFQYCTEDVYFLINKAECEAGGGDWKTYNQNFDNVLNGLVTLFVVSGLEGWPDVML